MRLDSAVVVTVSPDSAATFSIPAPIGAGVFVEASAALAEARLYLGDAGAALVQAQLTPTLSSGVLRSATVPVPSSGSVQVVVTVPVGSAAATQVTLRARLDTSFDAERRIGRIVPGVLYGTGVTGCAAFGFLDVVAPSLANIAARTNDGSPARVGVGYNGPAGIAGTGVAAVPWRPVAGLDSLDLDQGVETYSFLTSGRWVGAVCTTSSSARFRLASFSERPETRPNFVTVGDTTSVEAIDAIGDVDTFAAILPSPTDTFFLALTGGDRANTVLQLTGTGVCCSIGITSLGNGRPLLGNTSEYFVAGPSRSIQFTVQGGPPTTAVNRGPYRVAVLRGSSARPEFARDTLVVGDTIGTETLWASVDRDQFVVNVAPGATFTFQLRKLDDVGGGTALRLLRLTRTGVASAPEANLTADPSGIMRLPVPGPLGPVRILVDSPDRSFVGRYEVSILAGSVP